MTAARFTRGAVSPARLCRPGRLAGPAHPAATAGFSIPQEKSRERRTVCWRGMDSNFRFRAR